MTFVTCALKYTTVRIIVHNMVTSTKRAATERF